MSHEILTIKYKYQFYIPARIMLSPVRRVDKNDKSRLKNRLKK